MFKVDYAAQVASYFLMREGIKMSRQKLSALMYLAECAYLFRREKRLTGATLIATSDGPELKEVRALLADTGLKPLSKWDNYIVRDGDGAYALREGIGREQPSHLSSFILGLLEIVYDENSGLSDTALNARLRSPGVCPEWQKPAEAEQEISIGHLFRSNGYSEKEVKDIVEFILEVEDYDKLIADLVS